MKKDITQPEEIGIRELKSRASEVVRAVKEHRARYIVTQRGVPVAAIIPMDAMLPDKGDNDSWNRLMEIRNKIGKGTTSKSSVEILSDMRR